MRRALVTMVLALLVAAPAQAATPARTLTPVSGVYAGACVGSVLLGGELRLTYADGTVEHRTIGIYRDSRTGSADPAKDGLWLDDDPFWKDDED